MRVNHTSLSVCKRAYPRHVGLRLVLLAFLALLFSCRQRTNELPLTPPITPPLTRAYIGFGVVNVSFTHLMNEIGQDSVSQGYLRRGTVVRIIERRLLKTRLSTESWILAEANYQNSGGVSKGWLQETTVDIYDSESKALNASKSLSQ